jgi:phosphoribosylformylglycinamidine synthase
MTKNAIIQPFNAAAFQLSKMSNQIIFFQGASTYSAFSLNRLNKQFCGKEKFIKRVTNVYLIEQDSGGKCESELLEKLLKANQIYKGHNTQSLYIAPRKGTISPWSSKATDILHNCGFDAVMRIELARCIEIDASALLNEVDKFKLYDRMTEHCYSDLQELTELFSDQSPKQDDKLEIINTPELLNAIDSKLGLALSDTEKQYLIQSYKSISKEPTTTELMMFAQANSEHCRHKIFNAQWQIDGVKQEKSLFAMIRNTEAKTPTPAISAYKDNSAVFAGGETSRFILDENNKYHTYTDHAEILIKVETHNHPTAISPFPGAATGSGGEIRDEAATGQGSRPKAGLTGYSVSHLKIPDHIQTWEQNNIGKPDRISSALEIMLEAPLGGSAFNNEFGRPNICGYFRSLEIKTANHQWRGYHKPIMLAGGLGTINKNLALKQDTQKGDCLLVLGGPAMLIGLGGGAASSMSSGSSCEDLDFASVQRGNPEMERRCQEVIDRCWSQGEHSPIRSIHDVGAGGLSNAMPELLDDAKLGGKLELRNLQIDTHSMTPMEIWCNESQERYVLSIKPEKLGEFEKMCQRERCPYALLGVATQAQQLLVTDSYFKDKPVDIPMGLLFGNTPKTSKNIKRQPTLLKAFDSKNIEISSAVEKILNFPTVASKKYLITIGDRTVSGLIHRDQMVGPWQVPVADCGVTIRDFSSNAGEAMSIGEKTPLALINGAASARMAVCEALMNIAANSIGPLAQIKLSANWMAASGLGREDEVLFDAVKAIGEELCPELGIGIPVGKDSLSMNSQWDDGNKQMTSPVSLIISAFANVTDVNKSITPYFNADDAQNLYYIDLAAGNKRLGASSLAQVYQQLGDEVPDLIDSSAMKHFWQLIQECVDQQVLSAYHDISDGGLFVAVLEMCIASQTGARASLDFSDQATINVLFSEELGAVVAVSAENNEKFKQLCSNQSLDQHIHLLGKSHESGSKDAKVLAFSHQGSKVYAEDINQLQKLWSQTSHWMASLRDNPTTCDEEFSLIKSDDPGLNPKVAFDFSDKVMAPFINSTKPKVAILREQGVNGQKEMAMAFHKAGFDSYDIHMQDLLAGKIDLMDFQGIAACGGFSYGDVLGAGKGWANSILFHEKIKRQFESYFADDRKFTLGVCNGCQMLSSLKSLIPGADAWPEFLKNSSEQFEARFSSIKIKSSNSIFFTDMQDAEIPIALAHGEGRAVFASGNDVAQNNIVGNYINNHGDNTQAYPYNPNGSQFAAAALKNEKGNVLIMMPHPERVFRAIQMSWYPKKWHDNSPWMRMFYNARSFVK